MTTGLTSTKKDIRSNIKNGTYQANLLFPEFLYQHFLHPEKIALRKFQDAFSKYCFPRILWQTWPLLAELKYQDNISILLSFFWYLQAVLLPCLFLVFRLCGSGGRAVCFYFSYYLFFLSSLSSHSGHLHCVPSHVQFSPQVQFGQVHLGFEQFDMVTAFLFIILLYTYTGYK